MAQSGYDTEGGGGTVDSESDSDDDAAQAVPLTVTVQRPVSATSPVRAANGVEANANGEGVAPILPASPTKRGHKKTKSTDTTGTVTTVESSVSKITKSSLQSSKQTAEDEGVEMSQEELLKHRTFLTPRYSRLNYSHYNHSHFQSRVSSFSMSSLGACRRRQDWKSSWTTLTGPRSLRSGLRAPMLTGKLSERAS